MDPLEAKISKLEARVDRLLEEVEALGESCYRRDQDLDKQIDGLRKNLFRLRDAVDRL